MVCGTMPTAAPAARVHSRRRLVQRRHVCGACVPATSCAPGQTCGTAPNGCRHSRSTVAPAPRAPNSGDGDVCGCTPLPACPVGACEQWPDGCEPPSSAPLRAPRQHRPASQTAAPAKRRSSATGHLRGDVRRPSPASAGLRGACGHTCPGGQGCRGGLRPSSTRSRAPTVTAARRGGRSTPSRCTATRRVSPPSSNLRTRPVRHADAERLRQAGERDRATRAAASSIAPRHPAWRLRHLLERRQGHERARHEQGHRVPASALRPELRPGRRRRVLLRLSVRR